MKNKQKCRLLPILLFFICQNSGAYGFSFQSQPSGYYNSDYSFKYQTSNSGYDKSQILSNSEFGKNHQISTIFGNGKPSFTSGYDQNGYKSDSSVIGKENYNGNWNRGSGFSQSRPGFAEGPKNELGNQWSSNINSNWGLGSGTMSDSKKKANSGPSSDPEWNSGYPNAERRKEGYGLSYPKKTSNNQQNGNFNCPLISESGTKNEGKPYNGNFGWTPGYGNEEPKTEGYGTFYQSKETSGNHHADTNADGFSFGTSSKKQQGSGKDMWTFNFDGDTNSEPLSSSNKKKTGKPELGSKYWSSKPEYTDSKQPHKGYSPQGSYKPAVNKPNFDKKNDQIDWDTLEKETKTGGALGIDVTQLWHPKDRKNPYGSGISRQTKKRNVGMDVRECYCTEFADCDSESIVDIMDVFRSGYFHLREKVAECAIHNQTCCRKWQTSIKNIAQNGNEVGKYQNPGLNQRPTCGKRVSKLAENDLSTEGLANYGDFPWILRMTVSRDDGEETLCSAALIHNSVALTTASCALLHKSEEIIVRAGEWYAVEGNNRNNIQERKIKKILLHPRFDFVKYTNDLALIFFEEPLDSSIGVNSVCLPSSNDVWESSRCIIAGWIREDRRGVKQPMLAEISLNAVTEGKCHNNSEPVHYETEANDPGYVCAHSSNVNPCIADSGALLMCPLINSDMQVLIGFLSQAAICNEFYKTAAFANILESMSWISHMEDNPQVTLCRIVDLLSYWRRARDYQ